MKTVSAIALLAALALSGCATRLTDYSADERQVKASIMPGLMGGIFNLEKSVTGGKIGSLSASKGSEAASTALAELERSRVKAKIAEYIRGLPETVSDQDAVLIGEALSEAKTLDELANLIAEVEEVLR